MESIKQIQPDIFSAYLFFPFAFDNSQIQVSKLAKALQNDPVKNWQISDYQILTGKDYNEYLYFYRYARDILFSFSKSNPKDFYFLRWQQDDLVLKIFTNDSQPLTINLESVYLHLYDFGVGVLIFELGEETASKNLQDYIRILNLTRRLYPSFLARDFSFEKPDPEKIAAIKYGECPAKIQLFHRDADLLVEHDYRNDNRWGLGDRPRQIPTLTKLITYFLDANSQRVRFKYDHEDYWSIVDDRMFVHSFYRLPIEESLDNKIFVQGLQRYFNLNDTEKEKFNEPALGSWYQLIFIDVDSPSCPNIPAKKKILEKATYTRWIRPLNDQYLPTFYGFSRFSSVMLTAVETKEKGKDKEDFTHVLHAHFHTMYYQIAVLMFFYRGALLSFSRRSAKIVKLFQKGIQKKGKKLLERLQKEFLLFRNRFWFKEVTAQDQGIEMFQKWAEQMNIFELMEDVKTEIRELYDYVEYKTEQKENRLLFIITLIGAFLLPLSVVSGFLGMNILDPTQPVHINLFDFASGWGWFWGLLTIFYLIIFPIVIYYQYFKKD